MDVMDGWDGWVDEGAVGISSRRAGGLCLIMRSLIIELTVAAVAPASAAA